jgi:hypothetical protein
MKKRNTNFATALLALNALQQFYGEVTPGLPSCEAGAPVVSHHMFLLRVAVQLAANGSLNSARHAA